MSEPAYRAKDELAATPRADTTRGTRYSEYCTSNFSTTTHKRKMGKLYHGKTTKHYPGRRERKINLSSSSNSSSSNKHEQEMTGGLLVEVDEAGVRRVQGHQSDINNNAKPMTGNGLDDSENNNKDRMKNIMILPPENPDDSGEQQQEKDDFDDDEEHTNNFSKASSLSSSLATSSSPSSSSSSLTAEQHHTKENTSPSTAAAEAKASTPSMITENTTTTRQDKQPQQQQQGNQNYPYPKEQKQKRQELVFRFTIPSHIYNSHQSRSAPIKPISTFLVSAQGTLVRIQYPKEKKCHPIQLAHVILPLYYNPPIVQPIQLLQPSSSSSSSSNNTTTKTNNTTNKKRIVYAIHIPSEIPEGDAFYVTLGDDDHQKNQYRLLRPYRQTKENTQLTIQRRRKKRSNHTKTTTTTTTSTSKQQQQQQQTTNTTTSTQPSSSSPSSIRTTIATSLLKPQDRDGIVYVTPPPIIADDENNKTTATVTTTTTNNKNTVIGGSTSMECDWSMVQSQPIRTTLELTICLPPTPTTTATTTTGGSGAGVGSPTTASSSSSSIGGGCGCGYCPPPSTTTTSSSTTATTMIPYRLVLTSLGHGIPAMVVVKAASSTTMANHPSLPKKEQQSFHPNTKEEPQQQPSTTTATTTTKILPANSRTTTPPPPPSTTVTIRFQVPLSSKNLTRQLGTTPQSFPPSLPPAVSFSSSSSSSSSSTLQLEEGWHCVLRVSSFSTGGTSTANINVDNNNNKENDTNNAYQFQWIYIDSQQRILHPNPCCHHTRIILQQQEQQQLHHYRTVHSSDGTSPSPPPTTTGRTEGFIAVLCSNSTSSITTTPRTTHDNKGNHTTTTTTPSHNNKDNDGDDGLEPLKQRSTSGGESSTAIGTSNTATATRLTTTTNHWLEWHPAQMVTIPTMVQTSEKRNLLGESTTICSYSELYAVQVYLKRLRVKAQQQDPSAIQHVVYKPIATTTMFEHQRMYFAKHLGADRVLQQWQDEEIMTMGNGRNNKKSSHAASRPLLIRLRTGKDYLLHDSIHQIVKALPFARDWPRKWKFDWQDRKDDKHEEEDGTMMNRNTPSQQESPPLSSASSLDWYHLVTEQLLDPSNGLFRKIRVQTPTKSLRHYNVDSTATTTNNTNNKEGVEENDDNMEKWRVVLDIVPLETNQSQEGGRNEEEHGTTTTDQQQQHTEFVLDCFWLLGCVLAKALLEGRTVRPDPVPCTIVNGTPAGQGSNQKHNSENYLYSLAPYLLKHLLGYPVTMEDYYQHQDDGNGNRDTNASEQQLQDRFFTSIQPQLTELLAGFLGVIPRPFLTVIDGPQHLEELLNLHDARSNT